MAFPFLEVVVGSMILMYIFETYLDLRQHSALKLPTLPKTLEGVISQEKFEKSRAYCLERSHFRFLRQLVRILVESAILFFKVLPWFWKITNLPFSLYSIFVIEAHHGFNKRTIWLFFSDRLKGIFLSVILVPPIVSAAILIEKKGGAYSVIYLWVLTVVLSLVMITIYPILIAPLFHKFTPLPEGQLREKIETLASSLEFPLKKLFVVDGSTRSSHSNAYMYGFFDNKRIVLYDTLIQQCKNDEEIVAVIAHELGHWKRNHIVYHLIADQICALLYIGGYTLVRNWSSLFQSFGFHTRPLIIALIIFQYAITPIQNLVYFARNLVSRAFEYQADAFAKKLGYASSIRASLVRVKEENLSAMNIDPWYSAYHNTHPTLVERLAAIGQTDKED